MDKIKKMLEEMKEQSNGKIVNRTLLKKSLYV